MITHNLEAAAIADRILQVHDGQIVSDTVNARPAVASITNRAQFDRGGPNRNTRREVTSGSSSVVDHRLAKARVASSNLVSRSIPPSGASQAGYGRNG